MQKFELRTSATPLAIATFILMTGTGVLMFFGINTGITDVIHQWFSWLFLLAIGAHVTLHVRSFSRHLQSANLRIGMSLSAAVVVLSLFSYNMVTGPQLKRPIENVILKASVDDLATLTHVSPSTLIARLSKIGVDAKGGETIVQLLQRCRVSSHRILAVVFLS